MTVNHPQYGTMCEICFRGLTVETCVVDTDGVRWGICPGDCAIQAGIHEQGVSNEDRERLMEKYAKAARKVAARRIKACGFAWPSVEFQRRRGHITCVCGKAGKHDDDWHRCGVCAAVLGTGGGRTV